MILMMMILTMMIMIIIMIMITTMIILTILLLLIIHIAIFSSCECRRRSAADGRLLVLTARLCISNMQSIYV